MRKVGRFLRFCGKWALILAGIYLGSTWLQSLDPESRFGVIVAALGGGLAMVHGSLKDKIDQLKWRVDDLSRRLSRYE